MSKRINKNKKMAIIILLLICLAGTAGYIRKVNAEKEPFYGTWRIEKAAMISDMYTGTTLDGDLEENLYEPEDFLGYELEYTEKYFRLGDRKYKNPEYVLEYESVHRVQNGGGFRPVDIYTFLAEEETWPNNDEDYTGETLLLRFDVDFADEVSYGKYNFIPVGTQCILLNEDAMIVGIWGNAFGTESII